MDTKSISGVEIFSAGKWNGDSYSEKDLDEMVKAFSETSKTLRPPLKLGHDDRQVILQQDGLPAAGWIGKLYREGKKLLADFVDIPGKIFDLINKGAYKKVSSEIYWDIDLNGKKYPRLLGAVALLGADMPAVSNLKDILSMYQLNPEQIKSYEFNTDGFIIKSYDNHLKGKVGEGMSKTEAEIKLELELEAERKKAKEAEELSKKYQKELEDKDAESEKLKQYKLDAEKAAADAQKALAETQLEKDLSDLQSEKLLSPAMKPYVRALLEPEKKEYSIQLKDKKEEKFSKVGLLKEILKLHASNASVNTEESSEANQVEGEGEKEKVLNAKIEKYAKEHKLSYSQAYKAVLKEEV